MRYKRSWWLGAVAVAAFPAVAAVAGGTYWLLRRWWPDRAVGWAMTLSAAPAAAAVVAWTDYGVHWLGLANGLLTSDDVVPADWLTLGGWGVAAGPVLGGLYWRFSQRRRERSPYSGQDERERRERAEERRRRWVAHRVQAVRYTGRSAALRAVVKPLAVPLGDELGPFVGKGGRGDLGGEWDRSGLVRVPLATSSVRHLVVLGGTGLGKTELTLGPLVEWALQGGYQVVYLSCKEPPGPEDSAAPRLVALAEAHQATHRVLIPGISPFDPMRGGLASVRDRLVKIEEWGDRYWQHCANLLVGLALELSAARGEPIGTLPDLVYSLIRTRLKELAKSADPRVQELIQALEDRATSGALTRYASMALHLREWVAPPTAGGWSFEDADVICAELPTGSRPEAGAALLRMMVRDFGSYLVSDRRQRTADGKRRPCLFVVEEAGAVAGDQVIGKEFIDLVERARTAGAKCVLGAQDPLGLGDERAMSAILTNASVITFQQTTQAEMVAHLAGTKRVDEGAALFDEASVITAQGSTRRQHASKVNPQWLRELGPGECYVIHRGRYRYVAATMTAAGYGLPSTPAKEALMERLHAARALDHDQDRALPGLDYQARELPRPRREHEDQEEDELPPAPKGW